MGDCFASLATTCGAVLSNDFTFALGMIHVEASLVWLSGVGLPMRVRCRQTGDLEAPHKGVIILAT